MEGSGQDGVAAVIGAGGVALVFAAIHIFSPRLAFLDRTPRSVWLSCAGGISTAYVFVHLLPELAHHQRETFEADSGWASERGLFALALAGLVVFYGLERIAKRSSLADGRESPTPPAAFWLHLGAFAVYNALIGYLLDEQARDGVLSLTLYAVAMGLHYLVNDRALYAHHGPRYRHTGRWVVAAATLAGWAVGIALVIDPVWLALVFALLAGSIVLNVIKEELPEERESNFSAFALGAAGYTLLLLIL